MNDITDELRDWVTNHYSGWPSKQAEVFAIADSIEAEYKRMQAESAKLRELACILAWCAVGADCDKCPINTLDFSEWPNGREICYSADDRMRELGIEVEG